VDRVVHRRGGDVAYVRRDVDGRSRLLELPIWMLDRSACVHLTLSPQPWIELAHLRAVKELLLNVARSTATIERHLSLPFEGDAHVKISSPCPADAVSIGPDPANVAESAVCSPVPCTRFAGPTATEPEPDFDPKRPIAPQSPETGGLR
jgi:hypothetical protein